MTGWTADRYGAFRVLLGAYLLWHFLALVPWGTEVFSSAGVLPDATTSPFAGLFPNVLTVLDDPWAVTGLLLGGALLSTLLMAGRADRPAAVALWYLWACLHARNPLIANPSIPFVGWVLLAHACLPSSATARREGRTWRMPVAYHEAFWVVLACAYAYAGWTKLGSPSWQDGSAIRRVLEGPLARTGLVRDLLLALPRDPLRLLTWATLCLELAVPVLAVRRFRPAAWVLLLGLHLGILGTVRFTDLSLGMLVTHLYALDPDWFTGDGSRGGGVRAVSVAPGQAPSTSAKPSRQEGCSGFQPSISRATRLETPRCSHMR